MPIPALYAAIIASPATFVAAYGLRGEVGIVSIFGNASLSPYALLLAANITRRNLAASRAVSRTFSVPVRIHFLIFPRLLDALRHRSQRRLVKHQFPTLRVHLCSSDSSRIDPRHELDTPFGSDFGSPPPDKIVQHGHFRPQLDQCDCQMRPNKSRPAGDRATFVPRTPSRAASANRFSVPYPQCYTRGRCI